MTNHGVCVFFQSVLHSSVSFPENFHDDEMYRNKIKRMGRVPVNITTQGGGKNVAIIFEMVNLKGKAKMHGKKSQGKEVGREKTSDGSF